MEETGAGKRGEEKEEITIFTSDLVVPKREGDGFVLARRRRNVKRGGQTCQDDAKKKEPTKAKGLVVQQNQGKKEESTSSVPEMKILKNFLAHNKLEKEEKEGVHPPG